MSSVFGSSSSPNMFRSFAGQRFAQFNVNNHKGGFLEKQVWPLHTIHIHNYYKHFKGLSLSLSEQIMHTRNRLHGLNISPHLFLNQALSFFGQYPPTKHILTENASGLLPNTEPRTKLMRYRKCVIHAANHMLSKKQFRNKQVQVRFMMLPYNSKNISFPNTTETNKLSSMLDIARISSDGKNQGSVLFETLSQAYLALCVFLNSSGFVHGDLRPENIFVSKTSTVNQFLFRVIPSPHLVWFKIPVVRNIISRVVEKQQIIVHKIMQHMDVAVAFSELVKPGHRLSRIMFVILFPYMISKGNSFLTNHQNRVHQTLRLLDILPSGKYVHLLAFVKRSLTPHRHP